MKKSAPCRFTSINHQIHYAMSFIGGGVEVISFIFLFKALIGFMTSNLIFGINTFANGKFDYISLYHIGIVVIWMLIAATHQLCMIKFTNFRKRTPWHGYAISLTINCFLLASFILIGQYMLTSGVLGSLPTPSITPLIIIGLMFMYIQNYLIKSGGTNYPTTTSVVTTVYVLMTTSLVNYLNHNISKSERQASLREGLHYLLVLIHFSAGAYITAKLSSHFGFYSLFLMLFILIAVTMNTWFTHSRLLCSSSGENSNDKAI